MKHIVRFEPGHDCMRFECKFDALKCHGEHGGHGLDIRFVAQGTKGAVQFVLGTGWMPQCEPRRREIGIHVGKWGMDAHPMDLGYHSPRPVYTGQSVVCKECEWCHGRPCYYDGSCGNASDAMYALVNGGEKALWVFLDAYYKTMFSGAPYPVPAEYPKPLRKG